MAGILLALSAPASAYVHDQLPDGTLLHWCVDEITLHLVSVEPEEVSLDDAEKLFKEAIDEWAKIAKCTMPKLTYGGKTDKADYAINFDPCDAKNVVYFVKDKKEWTDTLGLPESSLGFTLRIRSDETGNIFDADIVVADWGADLVASDVVPNDKIDLKTVLVHEMGHVLGMGHSEHPEATMYADQPPGETKKRDLHDDDVDGVCYLYDPAKTACKGEANAMCVPPDAGSTADAATTADEGKTTGGDDEEKKDDDGGGGCSTHPGDGSVPAWPAAALLLGLVAVLRRRSA